MSLSSSVAAPLRVLLPLVLAAPLAAQQGNCPTEPPLKHYFLDQGTVPLPFFAAGEQCGASFRAPNQYYPIEILAVRIGWFGSGDGATTQEAALHIYPNGLPDPGAPQFTLPVPLLTEGVMNEFDLTALPGNKIIESGAFLVMVEFANDQEPGAPALARDAMGCLFGRNAVFEVPGGWSDGCDYGLEGQLLVDVVYRPTPRPLCASPYKIFVEDGGVQNLTLLAGPEHQNRLFWIFGSASGKLPGFSIPPFVLPLNLDAYFLFTASSPNVVISNQIGFLDAIGEATALFSLPPGLDPALAGVTLNHAYLVYDLLLEQTQMVSNAMPIRLL